MRKTMQAIIIQKLFKIGLLSCISLLLSFVGVMGSTETSYATSSKTLIDIGLLPGLSVDILPSSTPTPTPTPTPTSTPASASTPIQPANATAVSQVPPVPTSGVLSGSTTNATSTTAKPSSISVSPKPTPVAATGGMAKPVIIVHLANAKDLNIDIYMLFLLLGVAAPLLLIIGGTLWLLVKWLINRRKLAMQATAQASPSIDSNEIQSSLHAPQSASDTPLSNLTPATDASEASGVPMQAPLAQPTYTPSDLRPITTAFPQPILTMHSNEADGYPLNGDLRPLFVDSLNLSLELTRPIESNGNQQMPLLFASPTVLVDAPISCMRSSPPISSVPR